MSMSSTRRSDQSKIRASAGHRSTCGTPSLANVAHQLELEAPTEWKDREALAARFDVSPFRLWLLFQSVDSNRDGRITKSEIANALTAGRFSSPNLDEDHVEDEEDKEEEDDDSDGLESNERRTSLQRRSIRALDELFDQVIGQGHESARSATAAEDEQSDAGEDQRAEVRNSVPPPSAGISFPQFSRITRHLWLQQLLNAALDAPPDAEAQCSFDCLDYSSGYYHRGKIAGNERTRDFFTAPRHRCARIRWIDVPARDSEQDAISFRMTILRLSVKYRFHPTSVEDAIDLEDQKPKVNSFEHSLLDLGHFNFGTVSWLRDGGDRMDEDTPSPWQLGGWALDMSRVSQQRNSSLSTTHTPQQSQSMSTLPGLRPAAKTSSRTNFRSYDRQATLSNISAFVMAEEEDAQRHYFITIPMFELSRQSQTSLDLYKEAVSVLPSMEIPPLVIEVHEATLGIFVASLPEANLVVTCSTKWRPTRIKSFKDFVQDISSERSKASKWKPTRGSGGGENSCESGGNQYMKEDEKGSLERVKRLLKKGHSIQRHRNSNWLMHAIFDAVVDGLVPISKIYEARLQCLSTRLFELQHKLRKRDVKEMIVMKRDLGWLQQELRPFARVIRHLIDDENIGVEVTHYLEDIEDHLLRTLEQLSSYAEECASLKDEYNAYMDRRMNDILYVLTLVTTLVVPGQFFTGYYGMNFEDADGVLGVPLLRTGGLGVFVFWCMTLGFTGCIALIMHRFKFFERMSNK